MSEKILENKKELWLIEKMTKFFEDYDEEILYSWKYYNSKDDYELVTTSINPEDNTVIETIVNRNKNSVTNSINVKLNGKIVEEHGEKVILEMYKDTTILLSEKIISYGNNVYEKEIVLQREEKVGDNIYLDIFYKDDNSLKKYTIYPDNKIKEEVYVNNIKYEEIETEEYYFNNALITYLSTHIYYDDNNNEIMRVKRQVEDIEYIDDNTAKITFVDEEDDYETFIEYVVKKY